MKTTKYEIELPTLPDHLELCGPCIGTEHHYGYDNDRQSWEPLLPELIGKMRYVVARRKRTLADWANEQKRFMQFAEMRDGLPTTLVNDGIHGWQFNGHTFHLYEEANDKTGKLTLKNGKWEDAT